MAIKSEKFKTWLTGIASKLDVEDTKNIIYMCKYDIKGNCEENKFKVNTMKTRTRLMSIIFTQKRLTLNLSSFFVLG